MESNGHKLQDVSLLNLSLDLVNFYHGIVRKEIDSSEVSSNRRILNNLRKTYTNKLRRDDSCPVNFDSPDVRCAYLFQYCPSFTLAIASHFLTLMKSISSKHIERLALQDTLSICCLGGGPATEIVAICKVLQKVRQCCSLQKEKPLLVDATIVEAERGWATTSENVVLSLSSFLDSSVVQISRLRFLESDLTTAMEEDVTRILGQSDVVTMTKVLSALHGPKDVSVRTEILQDTCEHMLDGSTLFLLDSSGWKGFDETVQIVGSLVQMEPVFGPVKKTSRMSKTSKMTCRNLFSSLYGHQVCSAWSSNKAAGWRKRPSATV